MCIRDSANSLRARNTELSEQLATAQKEMGDWDTLYRGFKACLLYTSDAADERSSVDLGGRRIIKKKKI